ncbi:MAG TPA: hypothetical protein ENH46_04770 [Candidatus Pacearchaeota archaeon]|nr:hypothetical protein [Candidatus Pacearchaeota archaeon]
MKIKTKIEFIVLIVAIIQILLLINFTVANSYMINQVHSSIENTKIDEGENDITDLINTGISLLIGFLSIKQIGVVSAGSDAHWDCCPLTVDGAICQDISSEDVNSCAVNVFPYQSCDENTVTDCKKGCCIDDEQGLCTESSTKVKCENDGGRWDDDDNCGITECQRGCCILGNNAKFVTSGQCEYQASSLGYELDFRDINNEIDCLYLSVSEETGACVYSEGDCNIKTETECASNGGVFEKNWLCSHPDLGTICERHASVNCVEDEDEIYWFDSCGNKENIYSSDKDASWNNGKMLSKGESCGSGNANIDSTTCGNCNYNLGSTCSDVNLGTSIQDGNFVCKDLGCFDEEGNERYNGESWCVYDNSIGEVTSFWGDNFASDPVGSRHWRVYCYDGEVVTEGCSDYRGEICTQYDMEDNGKTYSVAECTTNDAFTCLNYNQDEEEMEEKCKDNSHCMIKSVDVDEYFKFNLCVGKYPRGFDLSGNENSENRVLCGMASMTCTVVKLREWDGEWGCESNCECEDAEFAQKMNNLCVSLGDCGSYINYVGEGTDNIGVLGGSESALWTDYKKYKKPISGKYANPQSAEYILGFLGTSVNEYDDSSNGTITTLSMLGTITGGLGSAIVGAGVLGLFGATATATAPASTGLLGAGGLAAYPTLQAFGAAGIGLAIGMLVGYLISNMLGISGTPATIITIAAGITGALVGLFLLEKVAWIIPVVGAIVTVIIILWSWLSGWGDVEEKDIEFNCYPWEAPTGGNDCHLCNEDESKPCSEYRCESLGQACVLLNERTDKPICESVPNDHTSPVISSGEIYNYTNALNNPVEELQIDPTYDFLNEESKYVELRKNDSECIDEWTPVLFTLSTDEYAQCKYSYERDYTNFEDMKEYPNDDNTYNKNHTFVFFMPSLDALEVNNVSGDLKERFGNTNIYTRCRDYHDNYNVEEHVVNFCIHSGPDTTAAWIQKHEPNKESYIGYNQTESPLKIYLNEPAECKYDTEDKDYDLMQNTMSCRTGLNDAEGYGWPCNTTLTNLNESENKFYIKCKDKTWVQTQEDIDQYGERNVNTNGYEYSLYGSDSQLKIGSVTLTDGEKRTIKEGETLEIGFEPVSVDLKVETFGGALNGEARCSYSFVSFNNTIQFYTTYSDYHKQNFNLMMSGTKDVYIECEDEAGNIAKDSARFTIDVDSSPPKVVRIYNDGNYLKIITDEGAKCYYDFDKCNFNINNATSMTTGLSTEHKAEWITGKTYNIKCEDYWDNTNPTCAIKITPDYFG